MRTFCLRDNISHWCPEKHVTVVVKENKVKKTMQQRYLQLSMNELYAQFFEEHPKIAIGKTKFQSLNPQHVLYSLQTPRLKSSILFINVQRPLFKISLKETD